ncbi:hypothetical protein HPDFL43_06275 [Hoeflea phototrophica DFL-43]|uniref:Apea-like HEPN domain-containing protein n=1 Tax=Hoeflea phototrophica (strain DSM 17068 / NCIMB 14078 / DFL-43) TaxID=411684 RepID=A9D555_HOEPD|nr:hypothetical protein [Hoeflea phototrophica]EDQ34038.2 hypothetical protein HPDFL43_06275 [Hoeflea phototrophica DFL-43]
MRFELPIYSEPSSLILASLFLREKQNRIFDAVPISTIDSFIDEVFCNEIYDFVSKRHHLERDNCYFDSFNSDDLTKFVGSIGCRIFNGPPPKTYSFPVSCLNVSSPYHGDEFYILNEEEVDHGREDGVIANSINDQTVDGWVGFSAPFTEVAQKHKRIVMAAVSLRLGRTERTQKTIAQPPNGFLTHGIAEDLSWSTSTEHAPQLGYQINIETEDHYWLGKIDGLISSDTKPDRRTRKSLEYFYYGWFRSDNERVPFNFMAIDALFGQGSGPTGFKIKTGIMNNIGQIIDENRLDQIILIRNLFVHGACPDIYDSSIYKDYIKTYGFDPTVDIDYITASCLRRFIFGENFKIQPNPYYDDLEKLKTRGIFPTKSLHNPIITEI